MNHTGRAGDDGGHWSLIYSKYLLGGLYSGNEISHKLWLWLKEHNFSSLLSVFGESGPTKFSHKGNLLAFGEVASASAHLDLNLPKFSYSYTSNFPAAVNSAMTISHCRYHKFFRVTGMYIT